MVDKLKGENAIITGAAQGIGKAIVLRFAEEGANVLVADLDTDKTAETVAEIQEKYPEIKVTSISGRETGDISVYANCEAAAALAKEELGGCTILINNAGLTLDKPIHTLSEAWWNVVLNVVLLGSFNMIKAVAPIMKEQKYGTIWNVSSVAGISGNATQINYAAAKSGLVGLTKACAKELGEDNIAVNVVGFGGVFTRLTMPHEEIEIMGQKMAEMKAFSGKDPEQIKKLTKTMQPMVKKRADPIMPTDVADWFVAACSRDFHYMTGQWMIYAAGGVI